jgi:hypothetical protein
VRTVTNSIGRGDPVVTRALSPSQELPGKLVFIGAAERIRTSDPRITNAVLYRLSYRGAPTEWRFSNTRGLLTQDVPPANCRCGCRAAASLNRRDAGPTLPRTPMN